MLNHHYALNYFESMKNLCPIFVTEITAIAARLLDELNSKEAFTADAVTNVSKTQKTVDPRCRLQHVGGDAQMCLFKCRKIYSTICRGYGGRQSVKTRLFKANGTQARSI